MHLLPTVLAAIRRNLPVYLYIEGGVHVPNNSIDDSQAQFRALNYPSKTPWTRSLILTPEAILRPQNCFPLHATPESISSLYVSDVKPWGVCCLTNKSDIVQCPF